jgi:hypothetical protein
MPEFGVRLYRPALGCPILVQTRVETEDPFTPVCYINDD